jgi:hypothetical protein
MESVFLSFYEQLGSKHLIRQIFILSDPAEYFKKILNTSDNLYLAKFAEPYINTPFYGNSSPTLVASNMEKLQYITQFYQKRGLVYVLYPYFSKIVKNSPSENVKYIMENFVIKRLSNRTMSLLCGWSTPENVKYYYADQRELLSCESGKPLLKAVKHNNLPNVRFLTGKYLEFGLIAGALYIFEQAIKGGNLEIIQCLHDTFTETSVVFKIDIYFVRVAMETKNIATINCLFTLVKDKSTMADQISSMCFKNIVSITECLYDFVIENCTAAADFSDLFTVAVFTENLDLMKRVWKLLQKFGKESSIYSQKIMEGRFPLRISRFLFSIDFEEKFGV